MSHYLFSNWFMGFGLRIPNYSLSTIACESHTSTHALPFEFDNPLVPMFEKLKLLINTSFFKCESEEWNVFNWNLLLRQHCSLTKYTQQQFKKAILHHGWQVDWRVRGGQRGFQGIKIVRPSRAPRFQLDGPGTARAIQNFIANPPTHPPIEVSHPD